MANDTYKIEVNVNGAPSGSDRLAEQQGGIVPDQQDQVQQRQPQTERRSLTDLLEERIGRERFDTAKKVVGTGTGLGLIALDLYQQDLALRGDSNRNLRINETKRKVSILGVTAGLLATGNYVGAALYVGYTALNIAKENRELIKTRNVDTYQSRYYQDRLVKDLTKRSR